LPPVAPLFEVEERPLDAEAPPSRPEGLESFRRELREAVEKLQKVLDQLERMTR